MQGKSLDQPARETTSQIYLYILYIDGSTEEAGGKLAGVVENKLKTAKEKHKQLGEQQKFADIKSVDCSSGRLGRQRRIK